MQDRHRLVKVITRSAYALSCLYKIEFPNYDITNNLEYFVLSLLIYIRNLYPSVDTETVHNKGKIVCTILYIYFCSVPQNK